MSRPVILLSAAACLVGAGVVQNARATIINVDYGSARTTTYLFQGQGAMLDPDHTNPYWNPAAAIPVSPQTVTNALASDGATATGVTVTVTGANQATSRGSGSTTAASGLLNAWTNNFLYVTTPLSLDFSITQLPANVDYTLYIYAVNGGWAAASPGNRVQNVSVTGGTAHNGISSASGTQATSFAEGVNYVIFTGSTGPGGTVNGSISSNSAVGGGVAAEINGLQISYVPEPATLGLLAIGGLMMLPRRGQRS